MVALSNKGASVEVLKHVLADTYLMTINTQNVHWNMEGPGFIAIHKLLDEHYEDLSEAVDEIAERIRALGEVSPASFSELLALARVEERKEAIQDVNEGIRFLVEGHEKVSQLLTEHIEVLEKDNDAGTIDLLTDRIRTHDKFAWLLRANLT